MNLSTFSEMKRTLPSSAMRKKNPSMDSRWGKPSHRNGGSVFSPLLTGTSAILEEDNLILFKMFINSYLPLMTMFHNRRHLSLVHRVEILGKNRFKYSVELIFANISEEEWWAFILWFKIKSVSKSVCNTFQVIIVHQSHIKQILPRDFLSEWCFSGLWSQASNWRPH